MPDTIGKDCSSTGEDAVFDFVVAFPSEEQREGWRERGGRRKEGAAKNVERCNVHGQGLLRLRTHVLVSGEDHEPRARV
jgi:hypothetical protein